MDMISDKCATIIRLPVDIEGSQSCVKVSDEWPLLPCQALLVFQGKWF